MKTLAGAAALFALNFVLLAGWMDLPSAFIITTVDWTLGLIVYSCVSDKIAYASSRVVDGGLAA